ncbi:MAG: NADP-dependent oxidoreductase [Bryobacterales bacterium]|nr:NADP-dependent oxidoreductase [Bryobacterales bacterium]
MNRQITLAARPKGIPSSTDFRLVESELPDAKQGHLLIRTLFLSVDPYMRGRMRDQASYAAPVGLGDLMPGGAVGVVEQSRHPGFAAGDIVEGMFGWQAYMLSQGEGLRKVDPALAPVSTALGVLGMTGLTAYFGMLDIAKTEAGESVYISGAAGAVGSVAGQIGKILGCHVAGSAGSEEKVQLLKELGFDDAFNYKSEKDYAARIRSACPQGIDVYFDNVGGTMTDAVVPQMNLRGRIAVCGQISQYNLEQPETGPRWLFHTIVKRLRIEGFLVFDFAAEIPRALEQMAVWYREDRLRAEETITDGLENAPEAFIGMLQGNNIGKQLVRVSEL